MFHFTYGVWTPTRTVAQSRAATSLETQKATLFSLHDEIAGLKAEWDANRSLSDENLIRVLKSKLHPLLQPYIQIIQICLTLTILFCSRLRKMKQMNSKFRQVEMAWGPPITLLVFTKFGIHTYPATSLGPGAASLPWNRRSSRGQIPFSEKEMSIKHHIFSWRCFEYSILQLPFPISYPLLLYVAVRTVLKKQPAAAAKAKTAPKNPNRETPSAPKKTAPKGKPSKKGKWSIIA